MSFNKSVSASCMALIPTKALQISFSKIDLSGSVITLMRSTPFGSKTLWHLLQKKQCKIEYRFNKLWARQCAKILTSPQ